MRKSKQKKKKGSSLQKFLGAFILIILGYGSHFFAKKTCPEKIVQDLSLSHISSPDSPILAIIDQPFTYFAKGEDVYAFESADGNYVIKVPKYKIKFPIWHAIPFLPKSWREESLHYKKDIFKSLERAEENLQNQTGLIYSHLGKTSTIQKTLTLKTRKRTFHIVLDKIPFYIQKKTLLFGDAIKACLDDEKAFRKKIQAFFEMVGARHANGLEKTDTFLWDKNYGYSTNNLVTEIDLGGFYPAKKNLKSEIYRYSAIIQNWLEKNASHLLIPLQEECEKASSLSPQKHLKNQKAKLAS